MPKDAALPSTQRQHGAMEYSTPPTNLDYVRRERNGRLRAEMKKHGVAGMVMFNQLNTRYATDATNMQIWCSHYETRCVFIAAEGPTILFDYGNYPHLAEGLPTVDEYRVIPSFYYFGAGSRCHANAKRFADQIAELMRQHGGGDKRVAIDHLGHLGCQALAAAGLEVIEGEQICEDARAIKSPQELALMIASIRVCEQAMADMRVLMEPGITENALWAQLHETNIRLVGEWIETRLLSSAREQFEIECPTYTQP